MVEERNNLFCAANKSQNNQTLLFKRQLLKKMEREVEDMEKASTQTLLEYLILAQLVHKNGPDNFEKTANDFNQHRAININSPWRSVSQLQDTYDQLLTSLKIDKNCTFEDHGMKSKKKSLPYVTILAQKLYSSYSERLFNEIKQDEATFLQLHSKIEAIQKGQLDNTL